MNKNTVESIAALIAAICNAENDPYKDAKFTFALAALRGSDAYAATTAAFPNYDVMKLHQGGLRPSTEWPRDALVKAYTSLIRSECPELYEPTRGELARKAEAQADARDCRIIDREKLLRLAAQTMGYLPAKGKQ